MFFLRTLLIVWCLAGVAAAEVMTLRWGDPALPPENQQGLLYWTNTAAPPSVPEIGALPVPDAGPNYGENILRKNPDGTWQISVNDIDTEEGRHNGGTGFIVLSWDGATPVVLDQDENWSLEATWELDSSIQQQYAVKKLPVKTVLPLDNMFSKSNSYLYIGTDFLERTNRANFRIGAEWPNEMSYPLFLLGNWVVRNNNINLSSAAHLPDDSTCKNIGTLVNKITVRLEYDALSYSVSQFYGINGLPPENILNHKFNVSPPQPIVDLQRFNTYFQANAEDDTFNLKVRGYATRRLGPIILTGNVISGVEPSEGEGGAEGSPEGGSEGSADGEGEGEGGAEGEGEGGGQGDCGLILAPCPDLNIQGHELYNVAFGAQGYNWLTTDHDDNSMIDSWEIGVFNKVLCEESYALHRACVCVFLQNRETFLAEQGLAEAYHDYADVIAALLSISRSMQQAIVYGMSLMGDYDVVHGLENAAVEPFSGYGNPDGDALINFNEYANILNNGMDRPQYIIVALSSWMDGTRDPAAYLPVTGILGLGALCAAIGVGGVLYRRKRNK